MKPAFNNPWNFLAVELAVKLQELLEPNEDYPPYEYYAEATEIIQKTKDADGSTQEVADIIAATLSSHLDFQYDPTNFSEQAKFLKSRFEYFKKYF